MLLSKDKRSYYNRRPPVDHSIPDEPLLVVAFAIRLEQIAAEATPDVAHSLWAQRNILALHTVPGRLLPR